MKKLFLLLIASVLLGSCKDVIKVDVKKGEALLVVDAFINNKNEAQTVRLTTTDAYFSNAHTPAVLGASVSLTDITNGKAFTFTSDGNGNYLYTPQANDSMTQIGHMYQLNVNYNGVSYSSVSKLNRTTTIDTILFKRKKGGGQDTNALPKHYYPYLIAQDAPGATDYYWIKTYKNGTFYDRASELNVVQDAGGTGTDGLFFIPPNAFFELTGDDDAPERLDLVTIEIYSINADTYDFFLQLQTQMNNSQAGLFATTPENVRTNITNNSGYGMKAIGWFNMGASSSKSVYAQ